MAPGRRLTIREVAVAAGVSTQTVSRVLNNRPDVAPETYERVQGVIAQTGYAPNMMARSLTQGRSNILGVVAYGLEYFGPSRVLTGIERQAAELGYAISLNLIHEPGTDDVEEVLNNLSSRQVDGVIWAIPKVGDNRAWLRSPGPSLTVPIMLVGGSVGEANVASIGIDNVAIGRLATEHLLDGGAKRIGIITGPLIWGEAQERLTGWRRSLEAHGMSPGSELVVEGDWTPASGEEGLYRLVQSSPDMDAVFASNDQMALGVLHAAHTLGRRIPEDLAVVGVDNIAESSHFWPPLTTVHQPLSDAGAMAVREIVGSITALREPRRAVAVPEPALSILAPELIVRESSRPIRSGG